MSLKTRNYNRENQFKSTKKVSVNNFVILFYIINFTAVKKISCIIQMYFQTLLSLQSS